MTQKAGMALLGTDKAYPFEKDILRNKWDSFLNGTDDVWSIPYMIYIFVLWYETCYET